MPYLSRIRINPLRSGAQALLENAHRMKIAVLGGVPERVDDEPVLWRLDGSGRHHPHLLVLTPSRPDWSHIIAEAGWPDADGEHALVRDYEPLLARLAVGREFAFRLTANPVQNTKKPEKPTKQQLKVMETTHSPDGKGSRHRGFRIGHRTARHQLEWLLKRTAKAGFEIPDARTERLPAPGMPLDGVPAPDLRVVGRQDLRFHKKTSDRGKRPPVSIITATFEGRLRVTDPQLLRTALLNGMGPAKRYGCGLLTLAPLNESRNGG
ncbi:type I-E CRISPR-associated protein Cas6/Cse3/CasE [Nocardiopsis sp. NPDC050513]|uniref:type I-E CRISPR-associated protein Cas6/Cse3/CasE n=1 Tax=Nocardiopsis sp. NPDC050513 TaxID=3364338 RepID=UPI0037B7D27B